MASRNTSAYSFNDSVCSTNYMVDTSVSHNSNQSPFKSPDYKAKLYPYAQQWALIGTLFKLYTASIILLT